MKLHRVYTAFFVGTSGVDPEIPVTVQVDGGDTVFLDTVHMVEDGESGTLRVILTTSTVNGG